VVQLLIGVIVEERRIVSRLWQFMPALVAFAGAVLVAVGGFWQSNFNAEIREKNAEITRLQLEGANAITGGDSFCEMGLRVPDAKSAAIALPVFVHHGKYPLYDVSARIVDLDELERRKQQGLPIDPGLTLRPGNMTPSHAVILDIPLQHPSGRDFNYNIFFVARNGTWTQQFRMHRAGDGWAKATNIVGPDGRKELFSDITKDFPRGPAGEIDWNAMSIPEPASRP
jgi:hypothetical protein